MKLPELETTTIMSLGYTNNQMKKSRGMDSILREEKGQWWENIELVLWACSAKPIKNNTINL